MDRDLGLVLDLRRRASGSFCRSKKQKLFGVDGVVLFVSAAHHLADADAGQQRAPSAPAQAR